jgi:pyridoxine 5-phosphate synthase
MVNLGVNIDHVATLRQVRQTVEPDPVWAAAICELAGADGITVHLREDRRHIQDRDVELLRQTVRSKLNLEMAVAEEIVTFATRIRPDQATLVPERREEVTTEGGLDVVGNRARISDVVKRLQDAGIVVSLFIDPERDQVEASRETGAEFIELHTGAYANARTPSEQAAQLDALRKAGAQSRGLGLGLNAGHGLTVLNVQPVAAIPEMHELNIGHSIISRAVFMGLDAAVKEMKALLNT